MYALYDNKTIYLKDKYGKVKTLAGICLYPLETILPSDEIKGKNCTHKNLTFKSGFRKNRGKWENGDITTFKFVYDNIEIIRKFPALQLAIEIIMKKQLETAKTEKLKDTCFNDFSVIWYWVNYCVQHPEDFKDLKIDENELTGYTHPYTYIERYKIEQKIKTTNYYDKGYNKFCSKTVFLTYHNEPYFNRAVTFYKKEVKDNNTSIFDFILHEFNAYYALLERYNQYVESPIKPIRPKDFTNSEQVAKQAQQLRKAIDDVSDEQCNIAFQEHQSLLKPFENEDYKVVIPQSHSDCLRLGNEFSNCLGGHEWYYYLKTLKRRVFTVFSKQGNVPLACVDLNDDLKIIQRLGTHNKTITSKQLKLNKFIDEYIEIIKGV